MSIHVNMPMALEKESSFHLILLRCYLLTVLKLHIKKSDHKEKFSNSMTNKLKER